MSLSTLKLALWKSTLGYKDLVKIIIRLVIRQEHEEEFKFVLKELEAETKIVRNLLHINPLDRLEYEVFERVHPVRTNGVFDYQPRYEETRVWRIQKQNSGPCPDGDKFWTVVVDWEATEDKFNEYLESSDIVFSAMVDAVFRFRKCRRYQVN